MPASVPPRSEGPASFGLVLTFYQRDPAYALGLAAISAHAKRVHPDVRVHLVPIMRDDPVAQVVDEVGALAPDLIGVSAMAPTWLPSDPYLRALKAAYPDVPICVGGYQAIVSPAEPLVRELARLRAQYGIEFFQFWDEEFLYDARYVRRLLAAYRDAVGVPFSFFARPETLTEELCAVAAAAGCHSMWMGVESGSDA